MIKSDGKEERINDEKLSIYDFSFIFISELIRKERIMIIILSCFLYRRKLST